MAWIGLAILAHLGNAFVFVIDKGILGSGEAVGRPARYAAYSGMVAAGAAVLLAYEFVLPTLPVVGWSLLAGVLWVAALWLFFVALQAGEASRVVPLVGSAVPVWTAGFGFAVLGEQLTTEAWWGVGILILGGGLLSVHWRSILALPVPALLAVLGAGACFAAHFSIVKVVYDTFPWFWAALAYTRLGVGVAAIGLWVSLLPRQSVPAKKTRQTASGSRLVWSAFWGSKLLGMVALVLQNRAISLGSVTVVNALQGTQYIFVLVLAVVLSRWLPRLFKEEVKGGILAQKVAGSGLVALGLWLVV